MARNRLFILGIVIAVAAWMLFKGGSRGVEPLHAPPYIVVYGRDSCGYTQGMLRALQQAGVAFRYEVVDRPAVADLLHDRMERSGISTRRYPLPVVDVNGRMSVRPKLDEVLTAHRNN